MNTPLVQVFDHILEGYDIPTPEGMLKISEEQAFADLAPIPYSFATNLQHAVLWQRFWLQKLAGGRKKSGMEEWKNDFRTPDRSELKELKREFVDGWPKLGQSPRPSRPIPRSSTP